MDPAFGLDGRVAVVTGGAGTIGRNLCAALAGAGARVVCASRSQDACEKVAAEIRSSGGQAVGLHLDLSDPQDIERFVENVQDQTGGVDILVNNAISQFPGPLETYPVEDWEKAMAVDATGLFRITQLMLTGMLERGYGNIITIASILGMVGPDVRLYPAKGAAGFRPSYFYSKAGVVGFTRYLATVYADLGIRANCISPGGVDQDPPRKDSGLFIERVPMKRLARPDDMNGAVIFLASEASAYVTGHNLVVDGGYTAW